MIRLRSTASTLVWAITAALLALSGCGGTTSNSQAPAFVIRIQGLQFQPAALEVSPGATVFVVNEDPTPHSVTSEASPGAFTPGGVAGVTFDTGVFTPDVGVSSFLVPSAAPEGTVVPFYCRVYRAMMQPPDGALTIRAGATPNAP